MSITLNITTAVIQDTVNVQVSVHSTTGIDSCIFVHDNTGTLKLGSYKSVCDLDELTRLRKYSSTMPVPIFANKFLRNSELNISLPLTTNSSLVISTITANVHSLSQAYDQQVPVTTVVTV